MTDESTPRDLDDIKQSVDTEADDALEEENADGSESEKSSSKHNLELRRTIEDHLERTRLHKELDYLYDEDFTENDSEDK